MRLLILGSNGYLGQRFSKYFEKKFRLIKLDKLSLRNNKIDYIINVSGPDSSFCQKYPKKSIKERVRINQKILKKIDLNYLKKYIYISTIHVYKKQKIINEKSSLNLINPYSKSHINAEKFLSKSINIRKLIILRSANCFGKPITKKSNAWKLVVNNLCLNLHKKNKININSKINFYRNFIPISYLISIIDYIIDTKSIKFKIMNVSSKSPLSILELAQIIKKRYEKIYLNKKIFIDHKIKKNEDKINIKSIKIDNKIIKRFNTLFYDELDELIKFTKKIKFK
jgi:UDP-glucose 4-epimerase